MRTVKNKMNRQSGFSLLEITFVFIITGLLMIFGVGFLNAYIQKTRIDVTNKNLKISESAMQEFFTMKGYYPCPSDPALPRTNANYGRAQCRDQTLDANPKDDCNGMPGASKCVTTNVDRNGDTFNENILIGALPFKTLYEGVTDTPFVENDAQDAMNMQFTYAVTEVMTNTYGNNSIANPANFNWGALKIVDENGTDVLDPPESGHFVLVSHGDDQLGGYTKDGQRFSQCLTALEEDPDGDPGTPTPTGFNAAGIAPEKENCDDNDNIFVNGLRSMADGGTYYDDSITYASIGLKSHWRRSLVSAKADIYNTNTGNVGVGTQTPTSRLEITKDLQAENSVGGTKFCNLADGDCLDPLSIAGLGMQCPPGMAAHGIENNTLVCTQLFLYHPKSQCGLDANGKQEFLVGFSNHGQIRCAALP